MVIPTEQSRKAADAAPPAGTPSSCRRLGTFGSVNQIDRARTVYLCERSALGAEHTVELVEHQMNPSDLV